MTNILIKPTLRAINPKDGEDLLAVSYLRARLGYSFSSSRGHPVQRAARRLRSADCFGIFHHGLALVLWKRSLPQPAPVNLEIELNAPRWEGVGHDRCLYFAQLMVLAMQKEIALKALKQETRPMILALPAELGGSGIARILTEKFGFGCAPDPIIKGKVTLSRGIAAHKTDNPGFIF